MVANKIPSPIKPSKCEDMLDVAMDQADNDPQITDEQRDGMDDGYNNLPLSGVYAYFCNSIPAVSATYKQHCTPSSETAQACAAH